MNVIFDRQAWVLKSEFDPYDLIRLMKGDLTVVGVDKGFGGKTVEVYEDQQEILGMPRHFFLKKFGGQYEEEMIRPSMDWPKHIGIPKSGQAMAINNVIREFNDPISPHRYGGMLEAKCGAGKTFSALHIASQMKTPTLVLVHKKDLMDQWKKEIEQWLPGAKIGIVQGNNQIYQDCHITIGMFQTILSRKDQLAKKGFFKHFGLVICDECHRTSASTFQRVVREFYAQFRLGLSATLRRSDGLECIYEWHLGKVITRMKSETVSGRYIQLKWDYDSVTKKVYKKIADFSLSKYISVSSMNRTRNNFIIKEVIKAYESGRKVLILSDRRDQIDYLEMHIRKKLIKKGGMAKVSQYVGGMTKDQLKAAQKMKIIIGTYAMFAEGTDVPDLDTLFFASPKSDVEQSVGRIQRPHKNKKEPLIIDLVDNIGICIGMSRKRRSRYFELGFTDATKR